MFHIQVEWLWQHIVVILLSFGSWIGIAYIVSASADIDQDFYYVSAFFLLFLYYLDYFYSNLYYWLLFLYCSSIVVVVIVVTTVMIWILLYLLYILYYNNILIHAYIDLVASAENRHFLARSATIVYTAMYEGHGDSCCAPTIYYRSSLTAARGKYTIVYIL